MTNQISFSYNIQQSALFAIIAENALKLSKNEKAHNASRNALDKCWEWIESQKVSGDDLYSLVDSGEEYDLVDIQVNIDSTVEVDILNCVINTILYICRNAYDCANEYLPQAIENVNESLYEETKKIFIRLDSSFHQKVEMFENHFYSNYTQRPGAGIRRSELQKLIN